MPTKLYNLKVLCIFFFGALRAFIFGQNIDSLKNVLKATKQDTVKCKTLFILVETASDEEWPLFNDQLIKFCEEKIQDEKQKTFYFKFMASAYLNKGYLCRRSNDHAGALDYYKKSLALYETLNDKKGIGSTLFNTGVVFQSQSDMVNALSYFMRSLKIREACADKNGLPETYFSIGSVYDFQGDIPKALSYYSKSLKTAEESGNKNVEAYSLNNIGAVYNHQGDYEHSIEYYNKSLKLYEANKDKVGTSVALNNIGGTYRLQGNIEKAFEYSNKALAISEEIGNKKEIAVSLNNIGQLYNEYKNDADKALDCFLRSLRLQEEIGYKQGVANSLCSAAKVYLKKKNYVNAEENAKRSLQVSKEIGFPQNILNAAYLLDKIYEAQNKPDKALPMYKLFISMRDSVNNIQTQKASMQREFQYNYDKKVAADSIANAKEKEIRQAQINQQQAEIKAKKNQQYALYGGLILVLIFAGFMYNRFKITQKQNGIITNQKYLIEEKHKEITDSINYAERIQRSFLATKNLLDENLKDYFVFFQPKAIVSGDFYWASKLKNGSFVYATADSTGHGVPGAIMSILNISSLEKAVEKELEPSAILNETRNAIIDRLKKDGSAEGGKDGMDCSLIVLDENKKQLIYSSANNPIWIIRESSLLEFDPDKMPVGKHDKDKMPFAQHTIKLNAGDIIYTFTDGFPDQFGGEKGKKFMYKKLKELLVSVSHLSMQEQEEKLSAAISAWKGKLEQTDDITVIGVKV